MDQAITGPDWFVVLVLMVIFIDAMRGFNGSARVFRWLKGSRVSFYLRASDGGLEYQSCNMRGAISVPVIELSRGPFRRQSALYGRNSENWKIAVGHWNVNSIELQDRKGIPVKTALKLVNDFPSLQAMLDRIANLEEELNRVTTQLDLPKNLWRNKKVVQNAGSQTKPLYSFLFAPVTIAANHTL